MINRFVRVTLVFCLSFVFTSTVLAQEFKPTPEQKKIESSLKEKMPDIKVRWNSTFKVPLYIKGIRSKQLKIDSKTITTFFVENFGHLYQIKEPDKEVRPGKIKTHKQGHSTITLYQYYNDIQVYGAALKLRLDNERRLQSIIGKWIPGIKVSTKARLNKEQVLQELVKYLRKQYSGQKPLPDDLKLSPTSIGLVIFNPAVYGNRGSENFLAYHIVVKTNVFFVDANTGKILHWYSNIQSARDRNTFNSNDCFQLPGTLVMNEAGPVGGSSPDTTTMNAHNFAGQVYDYYSGTHGRDGFDGSGATMVSTVHSGVPLDIISMLICCIFNLDCCGCLDANAAWIPSVNQVVYGDGGTLDDGRAFNPFPDALDVVAHEFTHAVIQYSVLDAGGNPAGLDYSGESGALNESYADFFASMVDRDDWLIGEDLVTAGYPSGAMRNMADPTNGGSYDPADPEGSASQGNQPDHMDNYVSGGDVHINSGIHNKVGYLIAQGGVHPVSSVNVKGIGRAAAENIFYYALTNYLEQTSTFLEARAAALDAVDTLYPGNETKYATVWNAYVACGICDDTIAGDCDPMEYPSGGYWFSAYFAMLNKPTADLALLRTFRDEYLLRTEAGKEYVERMYDLSDDALKLLVQNPEALGTLSDLISENKEALRNVMNGRTATIRHSDRIISFLERYALKSPRPLGTLLSNIKGDIVEHKKSKTPFLGFELH